MIIYVDIDETICRSPQNRDYSKAIPIVDHITRINNLYDAGNTIVYWTARGTGSGIDWREDTEKQFTKWGVKYHELKLSSQAIGAIMMALQKSLIEQTDVTAVLQGFQVQVDDSGELVVMNPPTFEVATEESNDA